MTIGLSYAPTERLKFNNYRTAIEQAARRGEYDVEILELRIGPDRIAECDGVLFTGGADIAPARYGKQAEERLCHEIEEERDQIEFRIAEDAEQLQLPTLGICRGLQLLNVHRGGSLVTDIETFGGHRHTKIGEDDNRHRVLIQPGSYLRKIVQASEGEINSAHHQAAERIGDGLTVSARATDGTVEALEWADPTGKPFFLAVQWHPERMDPALGYDERFAARIIETFLWETAANTALRSRTTTLAQSMK